MTRIVARLLLCCALMSAAPAHADSYRVVARYPHDSDAFTQGLFIRDGRLFESTGRYGWSEIREVKLADGKVVRRVKLPDRFFGEGSVDNGDEIISLTWTNGVGLRWRRNDFAYLGEFATPFEGWGLTRNADALIASDGSADLRFLDHVSFAETRRITVTENGAPVDMLNELEWVDGAILANVWQTSRILRIDPQSGAVLGSIDIAALAREAATADPDSVANGIAWDAKKRCLYVTGKNWSWLYEIKWTRDRKPAKKRRTAAP